MLLRDGSHVFDRNALSEDHAAQVERRWGFECGEGLLSFDTAAEARAAQQGYRLAKGYDPMTGERRGPRRDRRRGRAKAAG